MREHVQAVAPDDAGPAGPTGGELRGVPLTHPDPAGGAEVGRRAPRPERLTSDGSATNPSFDRPRFLRVPLPGRRDRPGQARANHVTSAPLSNVIESVGRNVVGWNGPSSTGTPPPATTG